MGKELRAHMRTNDITIAAYPKSGITWLSFMLVIARLRANNINLWPTFYNIDWLVIDSHKMSECDYAQIWHDGMGCFIKTHGINKGQPNVVYLLRNPYDTLKSYADFQYKIEGQKLSEPYVLQIASQWNNHVRSWITENRSVSQSLYLLEYEKLNLSAVAELGCMLGLDWKFDESANLAGRGYMRESEEEFARHNPVYARFNLAFVSDGKREVQGFEAYRDLIAERCAPVYSAALCQNDRQANL